MAVARTWQPRCGRSVVAERQVWKGGSGGGQVVRVSGRGRWEKRPRTSGPRHSRSLLPVPAPVRCGSQMGLGVGKHASGPRHLPGHSPGPPVVCREAGEGRERVEGPAGGARARPGGGRHLRTARPHAGGQTPGSRPDPVRGTSESGVELRAQQEGNGSGQRRTADPATKCFRGKITRARD